MTSLTLALVLVLRTYDMSGVSPKELAGAERAAVAVLHQARIDVSWVACGHIGGEAPDPICDLSPGANEIIVRMAGAPPRLTSDALADAWVDAQHGTGQYATVYVSRVRQLAEAGDVDPGTLMGRAIAHEVGHLLTGTSAHSAAGVMRPVWTAKSLQADRPGNWLFSGHEAALMRANLESRTANMEPATLALVEKLPPLQPCKKLAATCARTR